MKEAIKILERERSACSDMIERIKCDISRLEEAISKMNEPNYKDKLENEFPHIRKGKSVSEYMTARLDALIYDLNTNSGQLDFYSSKLKDIKDAIKLIKDNIG